MTDYHIKSGKDQQLVLRDTKFVDLMMKRVFNVLIVANPYDAFMLEDDGRVDEKIFDEYSKLGLRYPPRFFQVSSLAEAEEELERTTIRHVSSKCRHSPKRKRNWNAPLLSSSSACREPEAATCSTSLAKSSRNTRKSLL